MTYSSDMKFIETPIFTEDIDTFISAESYRSLQQAMIFRPDAGALIPGGAGLRKLRWPEPGKGKRGGLRIIYYWDVPEDAVYLLLVYRKSRQEDLTRDQLKFLSHLIGEYLS